MAKPFTVCALCIISTAVGTGIEPYFEKSIEQGLTELIRGHHLQQAVSPKAAVAAPADANVEVLGDRVKCDVRYQLENLSRRVSVIQTQVHGRKILGQRLRSFPSPPVGLVLSLHRTL